MTKLTEVNLVDLLDKQEVALPDFTPIARVYGLAAEVLILLLGTDWVRDNVFGKRPLDEFLRSSSEAEEDGHKKTDRIVDVAEMLFNFQEVHGVDGIKQRIKNDSIEACVAELQAASLLHFNGTSFRFIEPSNKKGFDFDGSATVGNIEIACEFKCKIESTKFSPNSLKNVLITARKQLSTDKPGLIFVKIPESWTRQRGTEEEVTRVIKAFLCKTTRVNSVILHWEEWDELPDGKAARAIKYAETVNPNAKFPIGRVLGHIILNRDRIQWTHFSSLIEKKFGKSDRTSIKPVEVLVLGNGYSWHSVIQLLPQLKPGEHVIFDAGAIDGTRITLVIGSDDCLRLEVADANLNKFSAQSTEPYYTTGLEHFSYLRFQLRPVFSVTELSIWVNNQLLARKSVPLNQSSILFPHTTLGADLEGKRNTAFKVTEIVIFKRSSDEIDQQMTAHFIDKFALEIPH